MSGPPDLLDIEVTEPLDGVQLVTLRGDLDLFSGEQLSPTLRRVSGPPQNRVVVDLTGLRFIDSSGVWMLISAAKSIEESGGTVAFAAPSEAVQRVFEILHLPDLMAVDATVEAALARVAASGSDPRSVS